MRERDQPQGMQTAVAVRERPDILAIESDVGAGFEVNGRDRPILPGRGPEEGVQSLEDPGRVRPGSGLFRPPYLPEDEPIGSREVCVVPHDLSLPDPRKEDVN